MNASYGVLILQPNLDKMVALSEHTLLAAAGPNCDTTNFTNHVQQQLSLHQLQNNHEQPLSVAAQANYCRTVLATALRKGPYQVDCMMGGIDIPKQKPGETTTTPGTGTAAKEKQEEEATVAKASLYWMDYLGTLQQVPYGCQGVATQFCLSIMDQNYHDHLSYDEALRIIQLCVAELQLRLLPQQPNFIVKCIDARRRPSSSTVATTADHSEAETTTSMVQTVSFGADPCDN
jgi:20S proteasome subunit beta 4